MFDKTDDQSGSEQKDTPNTLSFDDKLKEIVNEEGKQKYTDLEKALDALKHSQDFIPKLETDNKTLREQLEAAQAELGKRSSVEDVVSKLLNKGEDNKTQEPSKEQPSDNGFSEEKIAELVSSLLEKKNVESSLKQNQKMVEKAFIEKFGDNAAAKFQELAKETNISVEELQQLSAKSPNMVLKLVPDSKPIPKVSTNGVNTSALFGGRSEEGDGSPQKASKSVLAGATSRDLREEMRKHKEYVYKKHGITT